MAGDNRVKILLACQKCKRRNYSITKNKKLHTGKMELRKYCPFDREHTLHKETK